MQGRSALANSGLPAALLQPTPRNVKVSALGGTMLLAAAALIAAGMWGGIELDRRADTTERHVGLFEAERIVTAGDVIQLRRRGGGDDPRITAHYRYTARGRELTGEMTLRREDRDSYQVGSPVAVWYLPTEPEASWLDGYAPRPFSHWPATVVPLGCGVVAMTLFLLVRRQSRLLAQGRPALATVTRVEKKRTDKATYWMVHFEWTTLSGATRRGRYRHNKHPAPGVGTPIPIVYDRDNTFRHHTYPMALVRIAGA
jgi:hypothetical protein